MGKLIAGTGSAKTELDLGSEVSIPLTLKIADVKSPSKRSGSFSKTIKLPGTRVNNEFFGGLYDVNADFTQFNPNVRTDCILTVDNSEVLKGFIQLRTIDVDDLGFVTYNVVLYDSTVNFITEVGSLLVVDNPKTILERTNNTKSVNDIKFNDEPLATPAIIRDTQVDMNHIYNRDSLIASWVEDVNAWSNTGYYYPLLYSSKPVINIEDFQPAIYHKTLLDGIIKHHGYTWSGSLKTNTDYDREIIPYTGVSPKETIEETRLRGFKMGVPLFEDERELVVKTWLPSTDDPGAFSEFTILDFPNPSATYGFYENGNILSNKYTANRTGLHKFNINVQLKSQLEYEVFSTNINNTPYLHTTAHTLSLTILDGGGTVQQQIDVPLESSVINLSNLDTFNVPIIKTTETNVNINSINGNNGLPEILLYEGWEVYFNLNNVSSGVLDSNGTPITTTPLDVLSYQLQTFNLDGAGTSFLQCVGISSPITEWQDIDYSNFIPKKLKQVDVINDLIARYNCYIYTNPENPKDIIFDIGKEFHANAPIKDWTNKKDNNQRDEVTMLGASLTASALLTYTEAKDTRNVDYQNATGEVFGQYEYDFDNDFAKGENLIKTPFEPSPIRKNGYGTAIVPSLSPNASTAKFRVLYASPKMINSDGIPITYFVLDYFSTNTSTTYTADYRYTYPYAGCYNYPFDIATSNETEWLPTNWESLNFGQLAFLDVDLGTTQPERTLEFKFWRNTLRQVSLSRLLVAYFDLTPSDIDYVRLNPNVKIYVNNKYWHVNVATFEGNSNIRRLTKVELISIE